MIYDRIGASQRIGRHLSTIYRWEDLGIITFTLNRIREDDLLAADRAMRNRRGRPKGKSAKSENKVC